MPSLFFYTPTPSFCIITKRRKMQRWKGMINDFSTGNIKYHFVRIENIPIKKKKKWSIWSNNNVMRFQKAIQRKRLSLHNWSSRNVYIIKNAMIRLIEGIINHANVFLSRVGSKINSLSNSLYCCFSVQHNTGFQTFFLKTFT